MVAAKDSSSPAGSFPREPAGDGPSTGLRLAPANDRAPPELTLEQREQLERLFVTTGFS